MAAVAAIVRRVPAKCLMHVYTAPAFSGAEALLTHIAAARGKLRKGGIPDLPAAARLVIQDWNDGRIPYYTRPPSRGNEGHEAAALVATMAAEFDVDKVYAAEASAVIAGLQDDAAAAFAEAQPGAAAQVRLGGCCLFRILMRVVLDLHVHACMFDGASAVGVQVSMYNLLAGGLCGSRRRGGRGRSRRTGGW